MSGHARSKNLKQGLQIRTKKTAFEKYIYIQLNKYYAICYLTFDVDREGAGAEWYFELDLPAPTFVTVNPENLYAHLVYELITPVLLWENARQKPIEWLNAVRRAWTEALRADAGYNGLISKNPNHSLNPLSVCISANHFNRMICCPSQNLLARCWRWLQTY